MIHQLLLLRKIQPMIDDELQVLVGSTKVRFEVGELALITNLNFTASLLETDMKEHSAGNRLFELLFNDATVVNWKALGDLFYICKEKEDI